jgi:hypothetical protein
MGLFALKEHLQAISDAGFCNAEKKFLRKRLIDNVSMASHTSMPLAVQLESTLTAAAKVLGKMPDGQPLRAPRLQRILVKHGCHELATRISKLNRARRQECHPDITLAGAVSDALLRPGSIVDTFEDIDATMEHEIEDWMRDTCLSADALPFIPCPTVCEPSPPSCQFNAPSDVNILLQVLSDKLSICVLKLENLSAKTYDDVKAIDNADGSTATPAPIDSVVLPNGPVASQSVDKCTIPVKKPAVEETPSATDMLSSVRPFPVVAVVNSTGSSSTDAIQPEMTLEDLQRQVAAHRLRHLAMDQQMEKKPRKTKAEKKMEKEKADKEAFMHDRKLLGL